MRFADLGERSCGEARQLEMGPPMAVHWAAMGTRPIAHRDDDDVRVYRPLATVATSHRPVRRSRYCAEGECRDPNARVSPHAGDGRARGGTGARSG